MSPYAEGIVLVERTAGVLKEVIRNLSKETKEMGRIINLIKLCMEVTKRPRNSRMVKADDQEFERVREFKDRLCGLVVRVPGYRSRGPRSIHGATRFSEK
jgi:hypothetical protein